MAKEQLDKDKLLALLAEADTKWFNNHTGPYREHLEFTAEYIVKNYNRELKKRKRQQIG